MDAPRTRSAPQRAITTDAAAAAAQGAVERAASLGVPVNVAVTDGAGRLTAFLRMEGAFNHSIGIAIDKAGTAAGFGFPTSAWKDAVANDALLRDGLNERPGLVMFGGGLPIVEEGTLIGGIGVSGGSAEQDEDCARAGLAAIGL